MAGREVFGKEELHAVMDVLERGVLFRYGFDEQRKGIFRTAEFEHEFARMVGVKYALGVGSGTAALKVALEALNLPRGKEVLTTCFTFVATLESISEAGLKPVLCGIDESLTIDVDDLERKITPNTVAIVPVHMMGAPCRMDRIMELARKHNLRVIEDVCQAPGASFQGKKLGAIGDLGCFSFDYVKLITTGEGGMVTTDDEKLYHQADWYHDHGHPHLVGVPRGKEERMRGGFNYRMSEIQGALGLAQLRKLSDIIAKQKENKKTIKEEIQGVPGLTGRLLHDEAGEVATFLTFFLPTVAQTERFKEQMAAAQVGVATLNYWHFATIVGDQAGEFKASREILERSVTLEIQTKMSVTAQEQIVSAIIDSARAVL